MDINRLSRRELLKAGGVAAAGSVFAAPALGALTARASARLQRISVGAAVDFYSPVDGFCAGPWFDSESLKAEWQLRYRIWPQERASGFLPVHREFCLLAAGEIARVRVVGVCMPAGGRVHADVLHPHGEFVRAQTVVRGGAETPPVQLTARTFHDGVRINFCGGQVALQHPGLFVLCPERSDAWWSQTEIVTTPAGDGLELGLTTTSGRPCEALLVTVERKDGLL